MKSLFKRVIKISLVSILFCFICLSQNINADNLTPVEKHGTLSLSGTNIVDENGDKFSLRGVSTHGLSWFPEYVNYDTFKFMRDEWKINVVRLAMYSDPNAGYNKSLHEKVKEGVGYAKSLGLYVIIDWHILNDNNPNMYKWQAIEFFKEMANLYKDDPNVIYEICNEPNGDTEWERDIKPYAREVISEIRKIDNDAIIIVGTPRWCQDVDVVSNSPIEGVSNVMYALHFYASTHKDDIRNKLNIALNNNLPVFVSEFGICDASGNGGIDENEANKWIELLESKGISYVIWNLSNKNESSALLDSNNHKLYNWNLNELSQEGRWFYNTLQKYQKDDLTKNNSNTVSNTVGTDLVSNNSINQTLNNNDNNVGVNNNKNINNDLIELNDEDIIREINFKNLGKIILFVFLILMFIAIPVFVMIVVKRDIKKNNNENGKSIILTLRVIFSVMSGVMIIIVFIFGNSLIGESFIHSSDDFKIEVDKVESKATKSNSYRFTNISYLIKVKNYEDVISVQKEDYEKINKDESVYVVYDKENIARALYSKNKYNYVGNKLK